MFHLNDADTPTEEQIGKAAAPLKKAAIQTLMATPPLRKLILDLRQKFEQIVDEVSKDILLPEQTGYSPEVRQKADALVKSFESYLAEHKDEIDALQIFY
jgi:type I restriction enzyme R subunit